MKVRLRYTDKLIDVTPETFGIKLAEAMKKIASSHVYFVMQQAYGEIDYADCEEIWAVVLSKKTNP